jgi:hypothetical protein
MEQLKSRTALRVYSALTALTLTLSILLSQFGIVGSFVVDSLASVTIVLGTLLELFQILLVIQMANRDDMVGRIAHRFAYVTLLVMILSFLSVVAATFLSSFSMGGGNLMVVAVMGYTIQASFGICLSAVSYHVLEIEGAWRK